MDSIRIRELSFDVYLGVYDFELEKPRPVIVDLTIEFNVAAAEKSDNLADTIDYAALCDAVISRVGAESGTRYALIERLAGDIATIALSFDDRIKIAHVRLGKPGAVANARTIEINITRTR